MWYILKTEFNYYKIYFLFMLNFLLIFCILQLWRPNIPEEIQLLMNDLTSNFVLVLTIFVMFQMWLSLRNKENRTYLHTLLPISLKKVAIARILMFYIPNIFLMMFITIFILLSKTTSTDILTRLVKISGVIICLFSIYFIFRDLFIHFIRRIGLSKERILSAALLLGVGFNLLGLFVFIKVKDGKMSFKFIDTLINFITTHSPFGGELGLVKFFIFFNSLAILSIITFNRCKTYLE